MLDRIIFYSFALLFFLTPLFWSPVSYELFEFNKMILVYGLTIVITGVWLLKMVHNSRFIVHRSPLDIPILLFLGANIASTIFSIDPHTSIWGYYSRSNGGLLSIISYTLLYFALTSNLNKIQVIKLLKIALFGGFLVALYAIPEHFGVSPSCFILHGQLRADCWIQDVQARVFATLGQPNWLAAYLAMLIFPALYFFLTAATKKSLFTFYFLLIIYYLAFTFTYSRGATLGFLSGLGAFIVGILLFERKRELKKSITSHFIRRIFHILVTFLLINILFGSALTRFQITQFIPKSPTSNLQPLTPTSVTQLEAGGTESGQIRLIVWQGALDIFKHYPIFGSGVETFAYSYYQFRPAAHNLVSEWDFLYNKAHNEFLNYLATTGMVGFGAYCIIIITFIIIILKKLRLNPLLLSAILASYLSYLVQNFFGFSVVIIAILFYLFPAIAFVATDSVSTLHLPSSKNDLLSSIIHLPNLIYRRKIYTNATKLAVILFTCYFLLVTFQTWRADKLFAEGERASEAGNPGRAYNYLTDAVNLRSFDPFYRSELGYAAASAALALTEADATLSAELKEQALYETQWALQVSPKNTSLWRTAIRTYFELSGLDETYNQKTIEALDKTISLAPTDAKLYYNKAVILGQMEKNDEAIDALKKAVQLKPNYRDAYLALGLFHFDKKQYKEAVESLSASLKIIPDDPEVLQHLYDWGKEGIATESGEQ